MAVIVNTQFKPRSFEEMLRPYQLYGEEYRRQEELIDNSRENEFLGDNLDPNSKAYAMWNQSNQELNDVANQLSSNGLSSELRGKIRRVAKDYKSTSLKLNQANQLYNTEIMRRQQLGDTHAYQNNNLSIDDFLSGQIPQGREVDLVNLDKIVGSASSALAGALYSSPDFDNMRAILNGQYYIAETTNGAPPDMLRIAVSDPEVYDATMNNSVISDEFKKNLSMFRNIYNDALNRVGFQDYDDIGRNAIQSTVSNAMLQGMQKPTYSQLQNGDHESPSAHWNLVKDKLEFGYKYTLGTDENGNQYITGQNPQYLQDQATLYTNTHSSSSSSSSSSGRSSGGSGSSTMRRPMLKESTQFTFKDGNAENVSPTYWKSDESTKDDEKYRSIYFSDLDGYMADYFLRQLGSVENYMFSINDSDEDNPQVRVLPMKIETMDIENIDYNAVPAEKVQ